MPSGFGELTDQAHDLVSAGDLAGAQRLLADALTGADPRPANATSELAEAASLHARVLVALGEPHSARGWAAYAYAASTRLYGRSDPRTVAPQPPWRRCCTGWAVGRGRHGCTRK